jgi:MoxR-like ATPase
LRAEVKPICDSEFPALLALKQSAKLHLEPALQISREEWASWHAARDQVALPQDIIELLAQLRSVLQQQAIHLSDRRWHRIIGLLKTSAYTNGRNEINVWDLWLTQFCAVDRPEQAALVEEWFSSLLGTHQGLNQERFSHVVKAFESQLEVERKANDLAFDDSGKIALAESISGGGQSEAAPRLTGFLRGKRYGAAHIRARTAQMDDLIIQLNQYVTSIDAQVKNVAQEVKNHLWIVPEFADKARESLQITKRNVEDLQTRCQQVRKGFADLPKLETDNGAVPEPIAVDGM